MDKDKANRRNWRRHRLVSVKRGDDETMKVSYAPSGNILFKTGVGNFSYDSNVRPHAVTEVENADGKIPGEMLTTSFNDFGKIEFIDDAGKNLRMDIAYGPDQQRRYSELSKNGTDIRTTVYAGEYEKVTENGRTREFYYLDGNTIAVRENGTVKTYLAFTDNLGSILFAMDENGAKVFDASYDAWGRQTVTLNTIGLHRGYTGHEMLNEFDIINMNGRLYDPVIGRFFSPDNYVQMPDNSQNFNRYSYCLNNPLKYTDPSGESIEMVAFALFDMGNSMMQASYEGKSVWKAGALSLLSSAASYGIGKAFKNTAATVGNELLRAGAHGLASGVVSALGGGNFTSSFISGAAASGIGSYAKSIKMKTDLMVASTTVIGGAIAWLTGGDFLQGAIEGMNIGFLNHAAHDKDMLGKPALCKVNPDGTLDAPYDLDGVVITSSRHTFVPAIVEIINTICGGIGSSLKDNSGNSTFCSNCKFYWHSAKECGFYGNQHVSAMRLNSVGSSILKYTGPVGKALDIAQIEASIYTDYHNYHIYRYTNFYNSVYSVANVIGGWAGAEFGLQVGAEIGSWFGIVGAIPGSIIGGVIFSIGFSSAGSSVFTGAIDELYGNKFCVK